MFKKLLLAFILLILTISDQAVSQQSNIQVQLHFEYLTINEGLSNNHINSICQDSLGYIWIASVVGINKFDGYKITRYMHNTNDSTSILSNDVRVVYLDSKNNLWIGSEKGLNLYNKDLDNFEKFTHKDLRKPLGIVEDIAEDKKNKLWIATSSGLHSFDLKTNNLNQYKHTPGETISLPATHVNRLMVDRRNNIWISVLNKGICVFDQENQKLTCFSNEPGNKKSLSDNNIECFYEDTKGNIWIGTYNNGINLFNAKTSSFTRLIPDKSNSYSTRVRAIFEDTQGHFFIGTRSGLYLMNKNQRSFLHCAHSSHEMSTLNQNSIICHFIDRTGCLWIGTFSGGVNYTDSKRKMFLHYKAKERDNNFLSNSIVYAIKKDTRGNLWIGTDNGLNFLNNTTNTFTHYMNNPTNYNSLSYNDVKALEWDDKGNLWIGTNKGGLDYYDLKNRRFYHYKHDPNDPTSLSCNKIYGLLFDSNKNLWVITNKNFGSPSYGDIQILQKNKKGFIHLKEKAYLGIIESPTGNILIGSVGGVWHFDKNENNFTFIENDSIIGSVNCVYEDSRGILWIGSDKGLVRYNPQMQDFLSFSEKNGYPFNTIYGILEDKKNNLWVSTNFGLIKLLNAVRSIDNLALRVYDKDDGLQSKQFNYNAYYKSKSGEMFFGGINGFNAFFPEQIRENPYKPQLALTNLRIFNKPVPIGRKFGDRVILRKSITQSDELILSYKENVFTIEFAALHYANPEKNQYAFMLEDLEKEWNYVGNKREATYTNLNPGTYTFRVKGSNNDGVWNEKGTSLKIIITPPFWKTIWFKLSMMVVIILAAYTVHLIKVRNIVEYGRKLEIKVVERTEELNKVNKELKDFAHIVSHDLKAPLRGINELSSWISEDYHDKLDKEGKENLEMLKERSQRMSDMIQGVLEYSRVGKMEKKAEEVDLNKLLKDLIDLLNPPKNIKIRAENKLPTYKADRTRLTQIFENLLSNAIKYIDKPKGIVKVGCVEEDKYWKFSISDNGPGIEEKHYEKIFKIFQTLKSEPTEENTGIGLTIVKKIIDLYKGRIWVESEIGKGTTFYFTLPKQ